MALSDFQTLVGDLVRDDADKISETQRDNAIGAAVARYSKDRPRPKVDDLTAAGGNYLDLPEAWEADFSEVQAVEYPVGEFPPSYVSPQAWSLYATPTGLQIMVAYKFSEGATVRLTYSISHQVNSEEDTIPLGDREPVCCLAAASLCDQLAGFYSGDSDSTIQADSVNHQSKSQEFSARARALRKRYYDELGIDTKKTVAAGVVVDLDLQSSLGTERLTHSKTYRGSRRGFH